MSSGVSTVSRLSRKARHSIVILVAALTLVSVLPAASGQNGEEVAPAANGLPDWTFAVYMAADNNLEQGALSAVWSMGLLPTNPNLQIVVLLDRDPAYDTSYGDWTDTRVFNVHNGDQPTADKNLVSWDPHERNTADPATLVEFGNFVTTNFPASNYAFVIDNHGGGWQGVCEEVLYDAGNTIQEDLMRMNEFRDAIQQIAVPIGEIDLLVFNACMMGHVDPFFELRDCVDVVVGSAYETFAIKYVGYNTEHPGHPTLTDGMLPPLSANTLMTAQQLGVTIVDQHIDYSTRIGVNGAIMAAFSVSGVSDSMFIGKFNGLMMRLIEGRAQWETSIEDVRHTVLPWTPGLAYSYTVDLIQFCDELADPANGVGDVGIRTAASDLYSHLTSSPVRLNLGGTPDVSPEHGGLGIYYPCSVCGQLIATNWESYSFAANTYWNEFLKAYSKYETDSTPPVTSYTTAGTAGMNGWWKSLVTVTLTATDSGTGAAGPLYTRYSLDGSEYAVYASPIVVTGEGPHTLHYYSVDRRGNVESTWTKSISIDTVAPVTGGSVGADSLLTLSALDATSTVQDTYYRIDAGPIMTYSAPFDITGASTVSFYSSDKAGNVESEHQAAIGRPTMPGVPWVPEGDELDGTFQLNWNPSPDTDIVAYWLSESANGGGYSTPWVVYGTSTVLTRSVGSYLYVVCAEDELGQYSLWAQMPPLHPVVVPGADTTPPVTSATVTGTLGNSGWYVSSVTVTLTATDPSGIKATYYKLDNVKKYTTYSGPFQVATDGMYKVYFYSVDNSDNTEAVKSVSVWVDKTAPTTSASANLKKLTITLSASDGSGSGIAATYYKLDAGTWQVYTGPIKVTKGTHTIYYYSVDNAGNQEAQKSRTWTF